MVSAWNKVKTTLSTTMCKQCSPYLYPGFRQPYLLCQPLSGKDIGVVGPLELWKPRDSCSVCRCKLFILFLLHYIVHTICTWTVVLINVLYPLVLKFISFEIINPFGQAKTKTISQFLNIFLENTFHCESHNHCKLFVHNLTNCQPFP